MRQKCDKFRKNLFCATVCAPVPYALPYIMRLYNGLFSPLLWAGCVAFRYAPTYSPAYGGTVSNTDPIHKGGQPDGHPRHKKVSTSPLVSMDCTDLCNRLKIALVLDALKIERNSITTLCPVCLIALSQNCDARRLPGWVNPLLDAPTFGDALI